MRLLTTDELFAVSGGNERSMLDVHDGKGSPGPGSATSTVAFFCRQISNKGKKDDCWSKAANTANCPAGWTDVEEGFEAGSKGVKGRTRTFTCKTDNSSDSDSGSDDSDDSGSGGSDSGKDD